jgi:hypothetical protein
MDRIMVFHTVVRAGEETDIIIRVDKSMQLLVKAILGAAAGEERVQVQAVQAVPVLSSSVTQEI